MSQIKYVKATNNLLAVVGMENSGMKRQWQTYGTFIIKFSVQYTIVELVLVVSNFQVSFSQESCPQVRRDQNSSTLS
jgi:hypothetical protein